MLQLISYFPFKSGRFEGPPSQITVEDEDFLISIPGQTLILLWSIVPSLQVENGSFRSPESGISIVLQTERLKLLLIPFILKIHYYDFQTCVKQIVEINYAHQYIAPFHLQSIIQRGKQKSNRKDS